MKKLLSILLLVAVAQLHVVPAYAYTDDNPFVEAMLRMMEIFGLIDRNRLPLGAPYLPSYGQALSPGLGGLSGLGGMLPGSGFGPSVLGMPGVNPMTGMSGIPGMSPWAGMAGYPGLYGMPGGMGWPNGHAPALGNWTGNAWQGYRGGANTAHLDGIWELSNGGIVVIKGNSARLYLARDKYQDFRIGYDHTTFAWSPMRGGRSSSYRYQVRDNRMVLQDDDGNYLLLRRRR